MDSNILEAGDFVHKLAGRKKIQELQETTSSADPWAYDDDEMNDDIKKAIIQIGLENSLASKYTSFVGIDRKSGKTLEDKPMLTRDIKNQVPSGHGGYGGFMGMSAGYGNSLPMPQPCFAGSSFSGFSTMGSSQKKCKKSSWKRSSALNRPCSGNITGSGSYTPMSLSVKSFQSGSLPQPGNKWDFIFYNAYYSYFCHAK